MTVSAEEAADESVGVDQRPRHDDAIVSSSRRRGRPPGSRHPEPRALGGKLPVNPSGGLKAKGHPIGATGAAQIAEITTQIRGEAGARQVDGSRIGLVHTLGGNTATVLVSLLGRD